MKACAGDWVEVLSKKDILKTLDKNGCLDELAFMPQIFKYCGQRFRICKSAYKMKTPAVSLEGVSCKALYSGQRMFCPRGVHLWWREIWLERVSIDACLRATLSSLQASACATAQHVHSI